MRRLRCLSIYHWLPCAFLTGSDKNVNDISQFYNVCQVDICPHTVSYVDIFTPWICPHIVSYVDMCPHNCVIRPKHALYVHIQHMSRYVVHMWPANSYSVCEMLSYSVLFCAILCSLSRRLGITKTKGAPGRMTLRKPSLGLLPALAYSATLYSHNILSRACPQNNSRVVNRHI